MPRQIRFALRLTPYVLIVCLAGACAFQSKVTSEVSSNIDKYQIRTVVVLPFDALMTQQTESRSFDEMVPPQGIRRTDTPVSVPPPGEHHMSKVAAVPAAAAEKVSRSFYGKLKNWEGLNVFAPDDAAAALKKMETEGGEATPEQRAAKVATKMSVDAAIIGRVVAYQERKGSKLGGETATVGFEVKLVSTDGTVLWAGNYYEKQKPFIQDARGSFERWFMFVTADELVEYGTTHLVDQFPFGAKARR